MYFAYFILFILVILSTLIMSYVSMALPIGPWIEPTIVLCGIILFRIFGYKNRAKSNEFISLTTAASGIAGIMATAFGFSFPTLYFIDKNIFNVLLKDLHNFCFSLTILALSAGSFGLIIANLFYHKLIIIDNMPFAIGELVYKMIYGQNQVYNTLLLSIGFLVTFLFLLFISLFEIISVKILIFKEKYLSIDKFVLKIPELDLPIDLFPIYLSIGFIAGHVITIPIFVGVVSKIFLIEPLYFWYSRLNSNNISINDFITVFSSGIVVFSALHSFFRFLIKIANYTKYFNVINLFKNFYFDNFNNFFNINTKFNILNLIEIIFSIIFNVIFLFYFNLSYLFYFYLLAFTFVCVYQLIVISGKMAIAPLGRYATFVMIPALFLFNLNAIQVTLLSTFVEIAGGVACDVLFGRKVAHNALIQNKRIMIFQWLGLIISSIFIGFIFWLLITSFGLGNNFESFSATRAQSRALLINFDLLNFDFYVLFFGIIFSFFMYFTKINAILILGGILMPVNLSLLLILGGLLSFFVKDREKLYPFFSGMFTANSLWMFCRAFIR